MKSIFYAFFAALAAGAADGVRFTTANDISAIQRRGDPI
jgi:hypothetical protein